MSVGSVGGGARFLSCALAVGIGATAFADAAVNPAQCVERFGTPGMVSYWTFDDAAHPGNDDVGLNHGTVVGGAMQVASGQRVGAGAMRFTGGTDHLRLDYAAFRKSSTDSFSVSAWFRADSLSGPNGMNVFGVGAPCGPDTGTFNWTVVADPAGSALFSTGRFCQVNNASPSAPVQAGSWFQAVAVYDAGVALLYLDGTLRSTETYTLGSTPAPSALIAAIGNNLGDPDTRGFRGLIDEVAFFNRALTQREVQGLYESSVAGRNYCEPPCSDRDGDGFGRPGSRECRNGEREDCNDSDAAIFPGAVETCDGLDDDCDGVLPPRELDQDGDRMRVCAGDCNDTNALVYAGALELYDGVDNDCDGLVDEGLDSDADGIPNFKDACPGTPAGSGVGPTGCPVCGQTSGHDDRSGHSSHSGQRGGHH